MKRYRFTIIIEKDEDGVYIASCPAFPGCHTQGDTYEEAIKNIKDAINFNITARRNLGEPIAKVKTFRKDLCTKFSIEGFPRRNRNRPKFQVGNTLAVSVVQAGCPL
jgi:predicted RNase H-like HicB family nuclease